MSNIDRFDEKVEYLKNQVLKIEKDAITKMYTNTGFYQDLARGKIDSKAISKIYDAIEKCEEF